MARLTVVVSQAQGRNPEKRKLEEDIIAQLMFAKGIDVLVVPHFYDLTADSTAMLALQGISGNAVVCSWMFPRAAHWLMDRNNLRGKMGSVLLSSEGEEEEAEEEMGEAEPQSPRVLDSRPVPNRYLYHLDLRAAKSAEPFLDEVYRIQKESSVQVMSLGGLGSLASVASPSAKLAEPDNAGAESTGTEFVGLGSQGVVTKSHSNGSADRNSVSDEARQRFENPTNSTALPMGPVSDLLNREHDAPIETSQSQEPEKATGDEQEATVERLTESAAKRRWYPVIDYSRCTNCMECIDFCLFGVYGVDTVDTILVDQPDNCRKGCPACSRVCPENAIMFPQHKTPAIAGSADDAAGFKIDLSKLFGAPDDGKTAEEVAARERDEQLMLSGRQPIGLSGIKRRSNESGEKDDLDHLIDQLDELDV